MIKANELRVGNLLDNGHNIVQVTSISLDIDDEYTSTIGVCKYGEQRNEVIINEAAFGIEVKPIPLAPAWLGMCGFVKDRNGWNKPGTQFSLTEKFYPCWLDRMLWPQDVPDFKHQSLQYLHQLENLFFALTGEDLQIKMP